MKISIGFKIAFVVMTVLIIEAFIGLFLIKEITQESLKNIINEEFSQTIELVENEFSFLEQSNIYMANSILIDKKDLKSIDLRENLQKMKVDNIILVDKEGKIVKQVGLFMINAQNLQTYHIVHQVVREKKAYSAIERVGDIFVFYTAVPIMKEKKVLGALLIGLQLSNRVLSEMSRGSSIHLAIVGDRAIGASSLKRTNNKKFVLLPVDYIEYLMLLDNKIDFLQTRIDNQEYFVKAKKLRYVDTDTTNASLMLLYNAKNYNEQLATVSKIQYTLIIIMLISMFLTVILLSRYLKKIFAKLIDGFKNVANGNYGERLEIHTNDELETLAHYFNNMSASIQAKDEEIKQHILDLENKILYISQLQENEKILYEKATVDSLTKLYNRDKFKILFDFMLKKSKRGDENVVLAILDIDFFKKVNDTFGHLVGDKVLKELADILKMSIRDSDIVARWGGEEFVLAMCVKDRDEAHYILEKLRKSIESYSFTTVGELTCSCGYSVYKDGEENDTIFQRADEALYRAKINGRNRVEAKI